MNLLDLPHQLDRKALTCRAIIETPKGRQGKFDYDPKSGLFELAGILPTGMSFPLAFGFIPGTLGGDGDPIDVLVLAEEDLPIGCLLPVRLLGVIEARQTEGNSTVRNDRIIAKASASRLFAGVDGIADLGEPFSAELARFFEVYNSLKDHHFEVLAIADAERAAKLIAEGSR
ncbi:inorganic diphosphatase [Novosphingobium sp. PS1R-30]|uniref:inorganic diphosphatase n=1 Tax=Novosphingobium anseongense TaxID=3133436 RepID=A0ABU8RV41_9SPHN